MLAYQTTNELKELLPYLTAPERAELDHHLIALEKTRRIESAQRCLLDFAIRTFPTYAAETAHMVIADHLKAVLHGDIKRLMIFAPPQSGKTELVSVRFVPFWLGHRPDDPVILTSYGASLAHAKSWEARNVVESPAYGEVFPEVRTDQSSRAKDLWRLAGHRGEVIAAGVGGPITGHGALLGIIDDPFESWEHAQSATIREKVWAWWRGTFRTRIWEGGAVVLVMTRWHEDDLAGRLLQDQSERWTVLRLPAMAESQEQRDENDKRLGLTVGRPDPLQRGPGQPLTPNRFSLETLQAIRRDVGEMVWTAEYQGVPRLPEGNRIKREWFEIVEAAPADARRVRYWDKAASLTGAFTSGVLEAEAEGVFYIEDVRRGQWLTHDRRKVMKQTAELDRERHGHVEIHIEQEPGSSGVDSVQDEIKMLAGFTVYADRVTGSKDTRLEPFIAQAAAGNVKLVRGKWNWDWLEEMCAIPNSRYRDQADGTAGGFNKLALGDSGGKLGSVTLRVRQR